MISANINQNWSTNMSKVPPSQTKWKSENVTVVKVDINRNQTPELFQLFANCSGSRGTLAREMLEYARKNMPDLQNK